MQRQRPKKKSHHHGGGQQQAASSQPHFSRQQDNDADAGLDFNPRNQHEKSLLGRPPVHGVTIDPPGTHINDDAVWVRRRDKGWLVSVSIADVPAIVPSGSAAEAEARERMEETRIRGQGVQRIFPVAFLDNHVSLQEGKLRPTITFNIAMDGNGALVDYKIKRTAFTSLHANDDGMFSKNRVMDPERLKIFKDFSVASYQNRARSLAHEVDSIFDDQAPKPPAILCRDSGDMADGERVVHEATRLANRVAADFLEENGLIVPYKPQKAIVTVAAVTRDYHFDKMCNKVCVDLLKRVQQDARPYVHLTSPMRHYKDYLALKILGRAVDGQAEDPALTREAVSLSDVFNEKASGGGSDYLLRDSWEGEWHGALRRQRFWHPFDDIRPGWRGYDSLHRLKGMVAANGWEVPLVAERDLMVQGAALHFTAISLRTKKNPDVVFRAWAVSHDRNRALETASARILALYEHTGPGPRFSYTGA
ncbi:MAG: RNB domain-containing ribonuclease [Micavibrio aeruginosavorus]|nr:RNB domain-containing ribonuclease [Micavibrio aeruginosavorus]